MLNTHYNAVNLQAAKATPNTQSAPENLTTDQLTSRALNSIEQGTMPEFLTFLRSIPYKKNDIMILNVAVRVAYSGHYKEAHQILDNPMVDSSGKDLGYYYVSINATQKGDFEHAFDAAEKCNTGFTYWSCISSAVDAMIDKKLYDQAEQAVLNLSKAPDFSYKYYSVAAYGSATPESCQKGMLKRIRTAKHHPEIRAQHQYRYIKEAIGLQNRLCGLLPPSTQNMRQVQLAFNQLSQTEKTNVHAQLGQLTLSDSEVYRRKASQLLFKI